MSNTYPDRSRRANGDGNMWFHPSDCGCCGGTVAEVRVTITETGKVRKRRVRRNRGETPARWRKRCEMTIGDMRADVEAGNTSSERPTMTEYFSDRFLPSVERRGRKASTLAGYERTWVHYCAHTSARSASPNFEPGT